MKVRKLAAAGPDGKALDGGVAGDMMMGHGPSDFWANDRRGVGQVAGTRLALWQGQWFLNTADGMPWATMVLGKYTDDIRDEAVQQRLYGTPGLISIQKYQSQLDHQSRDWTVNASLQTAYGEFKLAGPI